ncbi:unnamed protein product, partial [Arabidopsis halleri]
HVLQGSQERRPKLHPRVLQSQRIHYRCSLQPHRRSLLYPPPESSVGSVVSINLLESPSVVVSATYSLRSIDYTGANPRQLAL